jgi:hypothetical protein
MRKGGNTATNMGMKMTLRLVVAAAAAVVIGVPAAQAIVGGAPDGNAHPYVGMVGFLDSQGNHLQLCSGFLTSETVFVTAGHCAGPETPGKPVPTLAFIWFGSGPNDPTTTPPDAIGIPTPNPAWNGVVGEHDIGYVRITDTAPDFDLAALGHADLPPTIGYLDRLATKRGRQDVSFTAVGYGAVEISPAGAVQLFTRFDGTMQLETLTDIDLVTTGSPGNGTGGGAICKGDSGGPVFYGNVAVAVVSGGTKYCKGNAGDFRLDTLEAQGFIPTS